MQEGRHFGISLVLDNVPASSRKAIEVVNIVVLIGLLAYLLQFAWTNMILMHPRLDGALQTPGSYFHASILVGFALMIRTLTVKLVARIRAVLRRFEGEGAEVERIVVGGLEIDLKTRELKVDGTEIELTPTEFDLLSYLARHPGQVFTRLQLLREVQGYTYDSFARTIDTHVKNLRRKLGDDARDPRFIATVVGVGYKAPDHA